MNVTNHAGTFCIVFVVLVELEVKNYYVLQKMEKHLLLPFLRHIGLKNSIHSPTHLKFEASGRGSFREVLDTYAMRLDRTGSPAAVTTRFHACRGRRRGPARDFKGRRSLNRGYIPA